ncbi:general odorant-binding protein 57c-like [Musca autumnalis]|uniref:general odorant-binding protein 57c-like n=1 Tax=Musca autumnalis TaxID=221902 RepID=UPI003CF142B9
MNSLNIGFFLTLLVVGSISSEDIAKHVDCLEKNNLSQEEFVTMARAAKAESNEIDERMKCYTHCILESWGYLDANGKFDLSTLREKDRLTEGDMKNAEQCKNDNDSVEEKCEYSYQMFTCISKAIEQAKKDGVEMGEE